MVKQYTAAEIESKVYNHIIKKTAKGYTYDFNPLDVSKSGIADELNLDEEEVEEAIERLTAKETGKNSQLKRVESVKPRFEIWLPYTKGGEKIKDALCESGLAVRGELHVLYSFLFLVLCYTLIFVNPNWQNSLGLKDRDGYFVLAMVLTAISIPIGNGLSRKWYQANLQLQKIKGGKYYVYTLIGLIAICILSIYNSWNFSAILSGIGTVVNILLTVSRISQNKRKIK